MPIYEYECQKCGTKFEVFQSINASDEDVLCVNCGAPKPTKLFSTFASFGRSVSSGCETPGST